jgi:hypothetical protein
VTRLCALVPTLLNLVVECNFPLVKDLYSAFSNLLEAVSSQFTLYLSVALKSENIHAVLENKSLDNSFGVEAQLRMDSVIMSKFKDLLRKQVESADFVNTNDYMTYIMMFLFEELKLDARIEKAYDVLKVMGLPEQLNIKGQAESLKQSVNVKDMLDNFLPGAYDFLVTLRNNATANVDIGIYTPTIGVVVTAKLEGLAQFTDLVM